MTFFISVANIFYDIYLSSQLSLPVALACLTHPLLNVSDCHSRQFTVNIMW